MPTLTAILHTRNDALRIARAIESLRPCDEVLVVDHASSDETCRIAQEFGARVISAQEDTPDNDFQEAQHDWIFRLLPTESLSEALEASLYEWKLREAAKHAEKMVYEVRIEEATSTGWATHVPEVRLTHRMLANQGQTKEVSLSDRCLLEGHLLRLYLP